MRFFPADVGAENFRVLFDVFLDQADQLLAADAQARLAIGAGCTEQGVDPYQTAGNQQRRFEFALDLADLGLRQRGQALFDDLLELRLGALLHHFLRASAREQRVQHQRRDHAENDGAGQSGDGKLDRLELHGSSARKRTNCEGFIGGVGAAMRDVGRNRRAMSLMDRCTADSMRLRNFHEVLRP